MNQIDKYLIAAAILMSGLVSLPVHAQEIKIGVVDATRVLEISPQAEELRAQLMKEFSERQRNLMSDQERLKEMEERFQRDAVIMSDAERQKLQSEIIDLRRDLRRDQDEFRDDLNFRRNEEMAEIQQIIIEAIRTVARQNNYDLVLTQGVVYASTTVNMTELVVEYLTEMAAS